MQTAYTFECFSIVYDDVTKYTKIAADDDVTMMMMVSSSPSKDSFYFHMDGVLFSFICKFCLKKVGISCHEFANALILWNYKRRLEEDVTFSKPAAWHCVLRLKGMSADTHVIIVMILIS